MVMARERERDSKKRGERENVCFRGGREARERERFERRSFARATDFFRFFRFLLSFLSLLFLTFCFYNIRVRERNQNKMETSAQLLERGGTEKKKVNKKTLTCLNGKKSLSPRSHPPPVDKVLEQPYPPARDGRDPPPGPQSDRPPVAQREQRERGPPLARGRPLFQRRERGPAVAAAPLSCSSSSSSLALDGRAEVREEDLLSRSHGIHPRLGRGGGKVGVDARTVSRGKGRRERRRERSPSPAAAVAVIAAEAPQARVHSNEPLGVQVEVRPVPQPGVRPRARAPEDKVRREL